MKTYANLEELLIELDLNPRSKNKILDMFGKMINRDDVFFRVNNKKTSGKKYLVVTDDGHCHLFDKDGNLDCTSKIRRIYGYYLRHDVKKVIIPNSTTDIEQYAFSYTDIMDIVVPHSVTNIENNAFRNCCSLENILFKDRTLDEVKSMKNYPFGIEDESIISVE